MKNKIVFLFITAVFTWNMAKAQTSINDYKYVTVPTTFDFFTKPDQYRLNTLTKVLLEKYGLIALMEDEMLPDEAISNNCLVLKADVLSDTGAFWSKLKVQLKNCKNQIVFITETGQSREKNNQVSYTLALRQAFRSFDSITYQYKENPLILAYAKVDSQKSDTEIKKLKEEIKTLKEEKKQAVISTLKEENAITEVIEEETVSQMGVKEDNVAVHILKAQETLSGFQLVDNTSKVVYTMYKTSMPNVYLV
ncbi:MAG: hypothetical protein KBT69_02290, partial [Oceanihabitans sp.]|nr:hypothetical protein [Oceanihabitans sp.]